MKTLLFGGLLILAGALGKPQLWDDPSLYFGYPGPSTEHLCTYEYTPKAVFGLRQSIFNFAVRIYKTTSELSDHHFAFSPFTIWRTLAALAEGTSGENRVQLFTLLGLPEDVCLRRMFYKLAIQQEPIFGDVILKRNRQMILDSNVHLDLNWQQLVTGHSLIDLAYSPYKDNPHEVDVLKSIFGIRTPHINVNGNSLIFDSLDYAGLWTTAFSDATVEKGPFYNAFGEQIAVVEYMTVKAKAKTVYVPRLNMKGLELSLGANGRYKFLFGVTLGETDLRAAVTELGSTDIFEALQGLKETVEPIEIAIPRMMMTSETDGRLIMEKLGVKSLWEDATVTRNISYPGAQPSTFLQRVSLTITNNGVRSSIPKYYNFISESSSNKNVTFDPILDQDFILNKPFMFGLLDSELFLASFTGIFSKPDARRA